MLTLLILALFSSAAVFLKQCFAFLYKPSLSSPLLAALSEAETAPGLVLSVSTILHASSRLSIGANAAELDAAAAEAELETAASDLGLGVTKDVEDVEGKAFAI